MPGGDFSYWAYAKGISFRSTQILLQRSHSSWFSRPNATSNNNPFGDPFARYDAQGIEWEWYPCYAPGTTTGVSYPCFFRPDRDQYANGG